MKSTKKAKLKPVKDARSKVAGVLPEVVDHLGRTWKVEEGEPRVDLNRLTVTVPSGQARRHERLRTLTRVRVSPEPPDWARRVASARSLEAMEEIRAAKIVEKEFGLDRPDVDDKTQSEIRLAVRKGDQQEAARLALSVEGGRSTARAEYQRLRSEALDDDVEEAYRREVVDFCRYVDAAERLLDPVDYRTTVAAAHMIDDLDTVRRPGRASRPGEGSFEDLVEQTNSFGKGGLPARYDEGEEVIAKAKEAVNAAMKESLAKFGNVDSFEDRGYGKGTPFEGDSDEYHTDEDTAYDNCYWGTVRWAKPPLVRNLLLRKSSRAKRATDEGAVIRHMDRWFTDRRIFDRKRKVPGGTLLIDMSGSMSLTPEQVEAIIDVSPQAQIVTYSGGGGIGTMRLVANKGKRALDDEIYTTHGGNEIDGPALKWLATQQEPRVWVSDGMACTAGGDTTGCINWCRRFAKKNRIVRMRSADEAVDLLKRMW